MPLFVYELKDTKVIGLSEVRWTDVPLTVGVTDVSNDTCVIKHGRSDKLVFRLKKDLERTCK